MAKYSFEFKKKIVLDYLDGKGGAQYLSKKYEPGSNSQLFKWINAYKAFGDEGLIHIEEGHSENLKSAFGVNKKSIPSFIKNVIEQGKIVSNVKKGKKITRIYDLGGKHYVLCALGTNGFIVSVYPRQEAI